MGSTNENSNFDPEMNQEIILIYHRSDDCIVGADVQESVLNCMGQNAFSVKTLLQHTFSTLLGRGRSFSRKLNNLNLDPSMRSCDGLKKQIFSALGRPITTYVS